MSWNFMAKTDEPADDDAYQRRFQRWYVDFKTKLLFAGAVFPCNVFDLSAGGAGIDLPGGPKFAVGTHLDFELPGYGAIPAEVRYDKDGYLGLMFLHGADGEFEVGRYLGAVEGNRHRSERQEVRIETNMIMADVQTACIVRDISKVGACIMVDDTEGLALGQQQSLHLPGIGIVAMTVERVAATEIGVIFSEILPRMPTHSEDAPLWQRPTRTAQNFAAFRAQP